MVFSSPPLYLDPPNWQQHPINQQQLLQAHHHEQIQHHLIPQNQVPQPQPNQHGIGGIEAGTQQNRAHSMSERARLAKIPPPEVPLKCPRCDSTNTKFCYYNNYSLSQPRHFCKTCRRYWTRGGALRNVPVGGGCRRNNKRASSKSNSGGATSSKSTLSTSQSTMVCDPSGINVNSLCGVGNSGMSFMASLQNIAQLGGMSNMGLPYGNGSMNTHNSNTTPLGVGTGANASASAGAGAGYNLGFPQHQIQFPNFLGGFEIPSSSENGGLYSTSFQNVHQGIIGDEDHEQQDMNDNTIMSKSGTSRSIVSPVKMEDNEQQGLKLAKQLLMGISSSSDNNNNNNNNNNLSGNNCNQFWGGNMTNSANVATSMWTDLSRLNSSSTSHLL